MIIAVNFTWAIPGGMWLRDDSGAKRWETFEAIEAEFGAEKLAQFKRSAHINGMCGMWYFADDGQNVYVGGKAVSRR